MTMRRFIALLFLPALVGAADLEWRTNAGARHAGLTVPGGGKAGFTTLTESSTGIHFTNHLADRSVAENQIRLIGSGVALGDVDGDGRCDIFLARLEGGCALYRNLGGWKFADITARAGVACLGVNSARESRHEVCRRPRDRA